MPRLFDDASSQDLTALAVPLTVTPISIAMWVYPDDLTIGTVPFDLGNASNFGGWSFEIKGDVVNDPISFTVLNSGGTGAVVTVDGLQLNTWQHICGVESASNSRAAYLGNTKTTDTTSVTVPTPTQMAIGSLFAGGFHGAYMSGRIGWTTVWAAALTDAEVASLVAGAYPPRIRPASIVAFWDVSGRFSPERDLVGGLNLTLNGTPAVADPPRVYSPILISIPRKSAATLIASSDTAAIALLELSSILATQLSAETLPIVLLDVLASVAEFTDGDTLAVGLTEVVSVAAQLVSADAAAVSLTELTSIITALLSLETGSVTMTEASALLALLARADAAPITLAEATAQLVTALSAETVAVNTVDVAALLAALSSADVTPMTLVEAFTVVIVSILQVDSVDSVAVALTETTPFLSARLAELDTTPTTLAELTAQFVTMLDADTLAVLATEEQLQLAAQVTADLTGVSLVEAQHVMAQLTSQEGLAVTLGEAVGTAILVVMAAQDTVALQVSEQPAGLLAALSAAELTAVVLGELTPLLVSQLTADQVIVTLVEASALANAVSSADVIAVQLTDLGVIVNLILYRLGPAIATVLLGLTPINALQSTTPVNALVPVA